MGLGGGSGRTIADRFYLVSTPDDKYPNSLAITLILSLTLIKTSQVLFNYSKFRKFAVHVLTEDRKKLATINTGVLVMGISVTAMGYFLY